jgi:pyruvate kinase
MPSASTVDDLFKKGREFTKELGVAREGELVVITGGVPIGVTGTTNLLKVERI